jgi:HSP20 family protein
MTKETKVPVERRPLERPFSNLQRAMRSMFEDWDRPVFDWDPLTPALRERSFVPTIDLSEDEECIHVKADLPGIEQKDIEVALNHDVLSIRGEKKREEREEKDNFYRVERSFGAFARTVPIPCEIEPEKVEATFKNGVLEIDLPKSKASRASSRHIEVRPG